MLADGYFEWETVGKDKLPWLYEIDGGKPFDFAGLWEAWYGQGEGAVGVLHDHHDRAQRAGITFSRPDARYLAP